MIGVAWQAIPGVVSVEPTSHPALLQVRHFGRRPGQWSERWSHHSMQSLFDVKTQCVVSCHCTAIILSTNSPCSCQLDRKPDNLTQCLPTVVLTSKTLSQQWASTGPDRESPSRLCCERQRCDCAYGWFYWSWLTVGLTCMMLAQLTDNILSIRPWEVQPEDPLQLITFTIPLIMHNNPTHNDIFK